MGNFNVESYETLENRWVGTIRRTTLGERILLTLGYRDEHIHTYIHTHIRTNVKHLQLGLVEGKGG